MTAELLDEFHARARAHTHTHTHTQVLANLVHDESVPALHRLATSLHQEGGQGQTTGIDGDMACSASREIKFLHFTRQFSDGGQAAVSAAGEDAKGGAASGSAAAARSSNAGRDDAIATLSQGAGDARAGGARSNLAHDAHFPEEWLVDLSPPPSPLPGQRPGMRWESPDARMHTSPVSPDDDSPARNASTEPTRRGTDATTVTATTAGARGLGTCRFVPVACYVPLHVRLLAVPGTNRVLLLSESFAAPVASVLARQRAAGGLERVLTRLRSLSGQWKWKSSAGGVTPGAAREYRGSSPGLTHPEVASAATDDFNWLSRALSSLSMSVSKLRQQCRVALTDAVFKYCVLHWCAGADEHGTPFFNQHLKFHWHKGLFLFESPWRPMTNVALDCRPMLHLNLSRRTSDCAGGDDVYVVPVMAFDETSLSFIEMTCRAPPGRGRERPGVDSRAPAAGLICNAGLPVRAVVGLDTQPGQEETKIIHFSKLMPAGSTLAQLAAEAEGVTFTFHRVGSLAFEVDQRTLDYTTENWMA